MPDAHPDHPERPPTLQPVWSYPSPFGPEPREASFNRVSLAERRVVVVPFPWRLVTDPVLGAVYRPPWSGHPGLTAAAVYSAALDGADGFRFVD